MPNYCQNTLIIEGDLQQLTDFKKKCLYPEKETFKFTMNTLVPYPEDDNDWRSQNWGTKWDAIDTYEVDENNGESLRFSYSTAWSPNIIWLKAVSKMYPELKFLLYFEESGEFYGGKYMIINGITIENLIADLMLVDEQNNQVYYDREIDRYRYVSTREIINDEGFYPNSINRFQ